MPAPVEFSVQVASLPPGFKGDPQALAQAIAERLTITPSEPWSSFVIGATQPSSNVGPWAADGEQWKFWSEGLGTYVVQKLDGTGLIDRSVTLAKLGLLPAAYAVLGSNAAKEPTYFTGLPGQVVRATTAGVVAFDYPVTKDHFLVNLSTSDQVYLSDEAQNTVEFDTVRSSSNVTFDTAQYRVPVTAGSVWFFSAALQIENISTPATNAQHKLEIRINGVAGSGAGTIVNGATATARQGISTSGILSFSADGYVDVSIASNFSGTPALNFAVATNSTNSRFSGVRLF